MDESSFIPQESSDGSLPARIIARLKLTIPGYRLLDEISRGGQAIVYRAKQERTGRVVAVKVLRDGSLANEGARERLRRELSILASVDHPSIVNVIDSGETSEGHEFLVMNYITGKSLGEFMREEFRKGNPDDHAAVLLPLLVKICRAVNAVHVKGITHRDLSPSNILVDERGEPQILDFGLARTAFDRFLGQGGHEISVTGQFLGKLAYASPEQTRGESNGIDIRSDVYSLGVILYQMVSEGRFPYEVDGDPAHVLDEIVHTKPAAPSVLNRSMAFIDAVALKCLEKDPNDRHQNTLELARDVEKSLAGRPAGVEVGVQPKRVTSALAGRRSLIVLAALGAILWGIAYAVRFAGHDNQGFEVVDKGKSREFISGAPGVTRDNPIVESSRVSRPLLPDSPVGAGRIDLLKIVDPALDARNHGLWTLSEGALISQAPKGNELEFPYAVPAEYDYRITFRREDAAPCNLQFFFPGAKRQINWCVAVRDNTACGLDLVNEKDSAQNLTTRWAKNWTAQGKPQVFVAKVRKDHVDAYLNDILLGHYETDYHEIGLREWVKWERPDTVGVMFGMPLVKIVSAEVVEVTGKGKSLR